MIEILFMGKVAAEYRFFFAKARNKATRAGSEANKRVSEADTADMDKTYTPAEMATLAKQTAREVGAEVIRWWQDENDPHEVHIEAILKDKNISVLLLAILDSDA